MVKNINLKIALVKADMTQADLAEATEILSSEISLVINRGLILSKEKQEKIIVTLFKTGKVPQKELNKIF